MLLQSGRREEWEDRKEEELWVAFKKGSKKALSTLFLRYYDTLLRYGVKLIADQQATKDGIQKLFLRLWDKKEQVSEAESIKFYLLYSLRRILLRQKDRELSRQRRNKEYFNDQLGKVDHVETKIIALELEEEKEELYQQALDKLTNRQREILFLRLHHGMKNKEIAELTGLTHQRVRNYISESVRRLKKHIFSIRHN